MTGGLIRILVGVLFVLSASQASAQDSLPGDEYRWMSLFGSSGDLVLPLGFDSSTSDIALVQLIGRTFVELGTIHPSSYDSLGSMHVNFSDPELGLPEAFRRPRQARLSFRIRF